MCVVHASGSDANTSSVAICHDKAVPSKPEDWAPSVTMADFARMI